MQKYVPHLKFFENFLVKKYRCYFISFSHFFQRKIKIKIFLSLLATNKYKNNAIHQTDVKPCYKLWGLNYFIHINDG